MSFIETVRRARELLREEGRITLRGLRREFDLDDEALEELVEELVDGQQVAAREGRALAWIEAASTRASAPAPAPEPDAGAVSEPTEPDEGSPAPEAERRQLTVLFCDLVGSTELASGLDPEDWREIVLRFQLTCAEVIERFEGHVAQYLGDGLLVYFGWPKAHENDAERAVRMGLGTMDALGELNPELEERYGVRLDVRIGIHTGSVVVGEMGRGATRETLAMGETANLAARLQGIAEPGQVVVSGATLRLVQGLFLAEEVGLRELKGFAEPVAVYRVLRTTGVQSRLAVAAAAGLTPLVGREQELGLLKDRWEQVKEGMGQGVLISGEAGIGKSRLVDAFRQRLAGERHTWLECRCSPYAQDSALFPVTDLLRQALSLVAGEDLQSKPEQLERALEWVGFELGEAVPLMASLLSIPLPGGYTPLKLSPESQRKKTLALLAEWLLRLGRQQPVVILFEDLHWVDPSTQELLGTVLEQVPTASVLALYTFRPDFEVPWAPRSEVTPLLLPRLTRAQASAMIERIAAATSLPETWVQQIVQRSDGVPLFIEEITLTALESERRSHAGNELPAPQIPATLQDSLMARLDALGPVKDLAQLGAVLGREFSYELLLAVSPLKPAELDQALGAAVREELFYQRGTPPQATYLFKHALIQDAAYQSLLRSTRQRHHRRVAETLRARMPKLVEEQPELLARHLSEAGEVEPAVEWWQRAGERALERSANHEAARHFRRGLELVEKLPESETRERVELPHRSGLGSALWALSEWNDAESTWRRSLALAEHLQDDEHRAMSLYGLTVSLFTQSRLGESLELGQALRQHTEATGDLEGELAAWSVLIGVPLLRGELPSALEALGGFLERDELLKEDTSWRRFGASQRVQPRCWAAWALWLAGHRDRAIALFEQTLALARQTDHPITLCFALGLRGPTLASAGLAPELERGCLELIAVADEQGAPLWLGVGRLFQSWALVAQGEPDHAGSSQPALALAGSTGNLSGAPALLCCHAETLRLASDIPAALQAVDLALAASAQLGQPFYDAELHRQKGELYLELDDRSEDEAAEEFMRALDVARSQAAKSLELRAATSLARLRQHHAKRSEARNLLQSVYDWFTEGFDTQDLKDARALLEVLA